VAIFGVSDEDAFVALPGEIDTLANTLGPTIFLFTP
jgi:hypothetical protein